MDRATVKADEIRRLTASPDAIVRGSHRTWTLTLVLSGLWLLYDLAEMSSLYSRSRLQTVITVAVLALLFSPAVRRHCTKLARS